ncbi:hypothetical protein [Streptomyces sp. NPDC001348]
MAVDRLPGRVREFANYLDGLLARLDQGGGWCGVFWQRDPDGMRACLAGREVPPWDVMEALLHDLAVAYGTATAGAERERARVLHAAALTAHDARPGAREELGDRLDVMLREQRYAAERQAELGRLLASATTPQETDKLRLDLAWARDDHERATARCAELRARTAALDHRTVHTTSPALRDTGGDVLRAGDGHPHGSGGTAPAEPAGRRVPPAWAAAGGLPANGSGDVPSTVAPTGDPAGPRPAHHTAATAGHRTPGPRPPAGLAQHTTTEDFLREYRIRPRTPRFRADPSHAGLTPAPAPGTTGDAWPTASADGTSVAGPSPRPGLTDAGDPRPSHGPAADAPDGAPRAHPAPGRASHAAADDDAQQAVAADTAFHAFRRPVRPPVPDQEHPAPPEPARASEPARAPEDAPVPDQAPVRARQRKRRRGGARFAGAAEGVAAPAVVPRTPVPPPAADPAPGPRRTPRGARFAGAATEEVRPPQPRAGETPDPEAWQAVGGAVESLVRLRAEGRSGEAHALLAEIAHWPAACFPLLAAELERAGLGADWATLLWEAASLPADRLVAAADALEAAGRSADGQHVLRQGVARPAAEIGEAVLALDAEGREREVHVLLDACVRVRTPEEAARCVVLDPGRLVPLLLQAARDVSQERHWDVLHAVRVAGFTA